MRSVRARLWRARRTSSRACCPGTRSDAGRHRPSAVSSSPPSSPTRVESWRRFSRSVGAHREPPPDALTRIRPARLDNTLDAEFRRPTPTCSLSTYPDLAVARMSVRRASMLLLGMVMWSVTAGREVGDIRVGVNLLLSVRHPLDGLLCRAQPFRMGELRVRPSPSIGDGESDWAGEVVRRPGLAGTPHPTCETTARPPMLASGGPSGPDSRRHFDHLPSTRGCDPLTQVTKIPGLYPYSQQLHPFDP